MWGVPHVHSSIGLASQLSSINDSHNEGFSYGTKSRLLVARLATYEKGIPAELLGAPALQQVHSSMMIGADDFIGALTVSSPGYLSAHQKHN